MEEHSPERMGQRLKQVSKDLGLKQADLGQTLALAQPKVSDLMSGRKRLSAEILVTLYNNYGISPMYLLLNLGPPVIGPNELDLVNTNTALKNKVATLETKMATMRQNTLDALEVLNKKFKLF